MRHAFLPSHPHLFGPEGDTSYITLLLMRTYLFAYQGILELFAPEPAGGRWESFMSHECIGLLWQYQAQGSHFNIDLRMNCSIQFL